MVEGEIALARGHHQRARESLELAQEGNTAVFGLRALAESLAGTGDSGRAISCYEKLLSHRAQSMGWEAQQVWLDAHLALARLYIARGDQASANRIIEEISALWKAADADLAPVRHLAAWRK